MAINWDINAGTITPIVISFIGIIWRLHTWDVKTNVRHEQNTAKFDSLEASHDEIKRDIQDMGNTQKECQKKITETREMVIRLDEANKQQRA